MLKEKKKMTFSQDGVDEFFQESFSNLLGMNELYD